MGILDWFRQTINSFYKQSEECRSETLVNTEILQKRSTTHADTISQLGYNRDFLYGVLFGSFKNDFDTIKHKLHTIHTDLTENHYLVLGKSDKHHRELLGIIGQNTEQLGLLIEKAELQLKQGNLPQSLAKELNRDLQAAKLSLRQAEVYEIAQQAGRINAKQIAKQIRIAENTATEHLRNLEKLGLLKREKRGLYRIPAHIPWKHE